MRPLLSIAVVMALFGTARAQDAGGKQPDFEQARIHYQNAEQAMAEGRYAGAAAEYIVAHEITGDAVLFYKVGFAYEKAGNCEQALVYYRRYLRNGSPSDTQKTQTDERIAACGGKASTDAGTGAETEPDTGTEPDAGTGDGAGEETGTGTGTGTGAPEEPAPTTDPSFLDEGSSWKRSAGWIFLGTTVALATTGTILALSGQSREEDLQSLGDYQDAQGFPAAYEGTVRDRYEDLVDEGDRFNTYSKVAFVAAGVTAVAGITLLILDSTGGKSESGTAISRTLHPVVGRDHAGVAAWFRF